MSAPEAGLRQQTAIGLKWRTIEIVGRQCLSLVVFTALARLLQPADFGLLAIVGACLAFINILVDQGIGTALVQRQRLRPEHLDAAFWFNLGCALIMCAGTMASADILARLSGEPAVGPLLQWASIALVINATSTVQAAILVKEIDFRHLTVRTLLGNTVGGVVGIGMALTGYGVWSLIWQQLVASMVSAAFLWIVLPWRPSVRFSPKHLSDLLSVSASVLATSLLWIFSSRIDQLVIGRYAGAAVLGQYAIGIKLGEFARAGMQESIAAISMPALAKVRDDHALLRGVLYKAIELQSVIAFAVFGGLAAVAPSVVPLAFGEHWSQAGPILQLVSVYNLAIALSIFFHPALLACGGVGRSVLISVVCAIGALMACLIGIRQGVHMLIILLTVNIMFASLLDLLFLRTRIELSVSKFCRPCAVPAIAAIAMFAAVTMTRLGSAPLLQLWLRTLLEIGVGAAVYLGVVQILSPSTLVWLWSMLNLTIVPERVLVRHEAATSVSER